MELYMYVDVSSGLYTAIWVHQIIACCIEKWLLNAKGPLQV